MRVCRTIAETRAAVAELPRPLGLVPTMGALHAGHLSLVEAADAACAAVAASIFVNPLQFGPHEDYDRYPRDEARDLRLLEEAGTAITFVPTATEMYREGAATTIRVTGPLTDTFEGASRPGHFDGVATVVAKLLMILQPDLLFLGQKDAQQLAVVRRMVADLDIPVRVVGLPIHREADGLAMSSRNAYLSEQQRALAPRFHHALELGAAAAANGSSGAQVRRIVAAELAAGSDGPTLALEYASVVDPESFAQISEPRRGCLLVAAARLGTVRLIDNVPVEGEHRATADEAEDRE